MIDSILVCTVGISVKAFSQRPSDAVLDGKTCKNDERCWNGNTVECDEFGDGIECVCYIC